MLFIFINSAMNQMSQIALKQTYINSNTHIITANIVFFIIINTYY